MRIIKFRAWIKYANAPDRMVFWDNEQFETEWLYQKPKFVELMQFTGLHDKNGKEIYEGDIVKVLTSESGEMLGKVFWWKSCWAVNHGGIKQITYWKTDRELEVIGNIYSNPELAGRTE